MSSVRDIGDDRGSPSVLFDASRRSAILEHFRIPYAVSSSATSRGLEQIRCEANGTALLWPSGRRRTDPPVAAKLSRKDGTRVPIFGRVISEGAAASLLSQRGGSWTPVSDVSTTDGEQLASVWRADDGSVFVPFDPDEVRLNFVSEHYHEITQRRSARQRRRVAMHAYYRARTAMPRAFQIWLRRHYARVQARSHFPRWPVETGLHDFLETFLITLRSIAGEPVPMIAPWPNGCSWALVLTHDVETAAGLAAMEAVLELERSFDVRSSWNFVPRRYEVSTQLVGDLVAGGFEVGVHGLYHDGRDLESEAIFRERLPGMREAAARWNAVGFRSPATHRDWDLMPRLGFDYDSSYPDTDPFEPQSGGCCTWLPFFIQDMVELPLTMPQDHTLFEILRQPDERAWVQKANFLRAQGGLALLDTHPDYLADQQIMAAYERFLERFAHDDRAWRALPAEVSAWWRRRSQSYLQRDGKGWAVVGAATTDARVEFFPTDAHALIASPVGQLGVP